MLRIRTAVEKQADNHIRKNMVGINNHQPRCPGSGEPVFDMIL